MIEVHPTMARGGSKLDHAAAARREARSQAGPVVEAMGVMSAACVLAAVRMRKLPWDLAAMRKIVRRMMKAARPNGFDR